MKNKFYTFEDDLKKRLQNPTFRTAWNASQAEYMLGKALIEKRMKKGMSQRALAKKAHTTQAVISRIESMSSNPSLLLLKRIARALDTSIKVEFI
ncbi:MAG: helix-turn-helix transcriptional regulator [Candidatus Levybacteria bacterium]|nr:helix-turn-helix transcriptional regulator [Candidatus Levybacteria bacterium]